MNSVSKQTGVPALAALAVLVTIALSRPETTGILLPLFRSIHVTSSARAAEKIPDRLVVTRTRNNLDNRAAEPFAKTITDEASVGKLYSEIGALPPFPAGPLNCPISLGTTYHLDFYLRSVSLLAADYEPTGCASVRLVDGTMKGDPNRSFGADLRQALGIPSERQFLGLE
jgi:hypothetical protein